MRTGADAGAVSVLQVLRSLQQCFLNDSIGFLDETRFERLLPVLVSQLAASPPPQVLPALHALTLNDAPLAEGQQLDAGDSFGAASVAALTQMASAAGNDLLWKPLNHAVRPLSSLSMHQRTNGTLLPPIKLRSSSY